MRNITKKGLNNLKVLKSFASIRAIAKDEVIGDR